MRYSYSLKAHVKYITIKILLDFVCSTLVVMACGILVLGILGYTFQTFLSDEHSAFRAGVLRFLIIFPLLYTSCNINSILRHRRYESHSQLSISPDRKFPVEMVIYKNVYHTLYSISDVTRIKRT